MCAVDDHITMCSLAALTELDIIIIINSKIKTCSLKGHVEGTKGESKTY